jgi:hypothetical protein
MMMMNERETKPHSSRANVYSLAIWGRDDVICLGPGHFNVTRSRNRRIFL